MPRLKNRASQIPNGMTFLEPATGWKPSAWSSFNSIVSQVIAHRRGNPHVALKHKLATDQASVEEEVDQYNAKLCLVSGWLDYISQAEPTFPKAIPSRRFSSLPAAAGHVRKAVAGIKVYSDWLGSDLKAVAREQAESRALVCAGCKQNQDPDWIQKLEAAVANKFKQLIEIKNDLEMKTAHDAKLFSCQICDCPLTTKIHVPLQHILKETSEKTMAALRAVKPPCWIITEGKA